MPKVLIVDDEVMNRALFVATCATVEGIECVEAASPEEALGYFNSQHFDLVITDRSMPSPDMGERLVLDILAVNPSVPIIMVTGDGITSPPEGVSCMLHKPFGTLVLVEKVKEALTYCSTKNLHVGDPPPTPEEFLSPLEYGGGLDATTHEEGQPHHTKQPDNQNLWGYHAELVPSDFKRLGNLKQSLARHALYDTKEVEGADNSE